MTRSRMIDGALYALAMLALAATAIYTAVDPRAFVYRFSAEDGLVESGTALFLLIACLVLWRNAAALSGRAPGRAVVLTLLYGALFFFAAGEEVSWGYRLFNWEAGAFFREHNMQGETNIHNLVVGDVRLAKTLFGFVLTLVLLLYLVVLPYLYTRVDRLRRLADRLAVPVPRMIHAGLVLFSTVVIVALPVDRKWEVYEFIFAVLAVSIFRTPQNAATVT